MQTYIVDVNIPFSIGQTMQASDAIEAKVGPCDTGAGFGWRDLEIQCPNEADQQTVVREVVEILKAYDYEVAVDEGNAFGRFRAYVRTRTVESAEPEPEIDQPRGLIGPGLEE